MARPRRIRADHEVAPDAEPLQGSGETVTVACKLPHGLELRVFDMIEVYEPVMGGGSRMVQKAQAMPVVVKINGFAYELDKGPRLQTFGQFALTFGVDKGFFDSWLEQNADSDLVKNGLIFSASAPDTAKEMAVDRRLERSGLEAVDPTKKVRAGPFNIETAEA